MARYGMVIDLFRCIGCYGCQVACKAENATPPGVLWARVEVSETGAYPAVTKLALPLLCMHCRQPACAEVCPTGATYKREDGIVAIDYDRCLGCRSCMEACPYGARYFDDGQKGYFPNGLTPFEEMGYRRRVVGTVSKCNFCKDRIDVGVSKGMKPGVDRESTPACVYNCMAKARFFGDLEDPASEVSRLVASGQAIQLAPEMGTDPQVYYLPPGRHGLTPPGTGRRP